MIIVRAMNYDDLDQVCELEAHAFSMPWKKPDFIQMIESQQSLYFVAVEESNPNEILGCCGVRNIVMEGDISNVVVRQDARNKGIGKKMLTHLLECAHKDWGVTEFTLEVRVGNTPAIRLYESLGFKNEGLRKNFYEKPVEDAMIMWKR